MAINKKYSRLAFVTVAISVLLVLSSLLNKFYSHNANIASTSLSMRLLDLNKLPLGSEQQDISAQESRILEDLRETDTIVVSIGKKACFHILTHLELCHSHGFHYRRDADVSISTHTIEKDLQESKRNNLFGFSSYLTYDTITVEETLKYLSQLKDDKDSKLMGFVNLEKVTSDKEQHWSFDAAKLTFKSLSLINFISDLNVLYGEDCRDPRPNWEIYRDSSICNGKVPCFLARAKLKPSVTGTEAISLRADNQNKFKIVQLADLHFSVGKGKCRDEYPPNEKCEADPKTLDFIESVLDIEQPNLVVFTGDQIMGDECKLDSESALLKVIDPVVKRKIPYTMVWGNHDDEGSLNRWELSQLIESMPYSVFKANPYDSDDNSFGVGNYVQYVWDEHGSPMMALYFLDSHKYSPNPRAYPGYDWIKEAQWSYFRDVKTNFSKILDPNSSMILSMAFFHIPLPEYVNLNSVQSSEKTNPIVGSLKEGITAPKYNTGGVETLQDLGVTVASVGHDHCNDYCLLDDSHLTKDKSRVWLCYGGAAGEGGYAGYGGTERRIRIFDVDLSKGEIHTWKRLNGSPQKIFDRQTLVIGGVPNIA
ncbi:LAFE_0D06656g1_1 [Lachancea fermentati]|uniref:LAFE_0D06656g1_1 n=1 Tax=Lachancea fermentati TaxID=4955 RepID=A0A1G4MBA8_LACFM|nr:LAFE_0D06656g1_1 [Lachancea fermentati]